MTAESWTWAPYRAALRRLPVVVVALDRAGVVTVNEGGGLDVIGVSAGDAVGRSAFDLYAEREDVCGALRKVLDGHVVHQELALSGEVFDASYLPILENGETVGAIVFASVVTSEPESDHPVARPSRYGAAIAEMARRAVEAGEDLPAVWQAITQTATDLFSEVAVVHIFDDTMQWAEVVAYHHRDPRVADMVARMLLPYRVPTTRPGVADLLATGEPTVWDVVVEDLEDFIGEGRRWVLPHIPPSFLLIPLRARGRIIGYLSLGRRDDWPEHERNLATELADRAGLVADNARMLVALRHELAERSRAEATLRRTLLQQSVVARLSTAVLSGVAVPEVAQQAAEAIRTALNVDTCQVVELRRGSQDLRVIAAAGDPPGTLDGALQRLALEAIAAARPLVRGVADGAAEGPRSVPTAAGLVVSAPLQISAERVGAIIAASHASRPVPPDEAIFVETVGNVISAAMQQERVALAEQRAAEAERLAAIGRVAAGIAHDYDNILMAVRLYADLLREQEGLDDLGRRQLGAITSQVDLASAMAARVLNYARGDDLRREILDLGRLVRDEVETAADVMPPDLEISLDIDGSWPVRADRTRLRQVLLNLLANAADAMPVGGQLRVQVGDCDHEGHVLPVAASDSAGPWVCLRVSDTGVGMSAATLQRVPEPFFTTKLPGEGTGLGLAQAHTIIRQHDGHLEIHSLKGHGTTVVVWLPAYTGGQADDARREGAQPP